LTLYCRSKCEVYLMVSMPPNPTFLSFSSWSMQARRSRGRRGVTRTQSCESDTSNKVEHHTSLARAFQTSSKDTGDTAHEGNISVSNMSSSGLRGHGPAILHQLPEEAVRKETSIEGIGDGELRVLLTKLHEKMDTMSLELAEVKKTVQLDRSCATSLADDASKAETPQAETGTMERSMAWSADSREGKNRSMQKQDPPKSTVIARIREDSHQMPSGTP
jgi:hypothetical protein